MPQVWLIGHDAASLRSVGAILRKAGYQVVSAKCESQALTFLTQRTINIVISGHLLGDRSGLGIAETIPDAHGGVPILVIPGSSSLKDAGLMFPLASGARIEKSLSSGRRPEAHAAARWAKAVVPIIECPKDPRTIIGWSQWIAASPGAVRNWCSTAGITPRRSLVFGRLLRVVVLSDGGRRKPENLLDVVDRRTLSALLRLAGLTADESFPTDVDDFLNRQLLVRDHDALVHVRWAIEGLQATEHELSADADARQP